MRALHYSLKTQRALRVIDYILSLLLEKQRKILCAFRQKEEKNITQERSPFDIPPLSNAKILNKKD